MPQLPQLTYIYDMPASHIVDFWSDALIASLAQGAIRICMAVRDTSAERAALVGRLNRAHIPVVAWIVPADGDAPQTYDMHTAVAVASRYAAVNAWTTAHALQWDGIGIEISPDVRDAVHFGDVPAVDTAALLGRITNRWHIDDATAAYDAVLAQMRADGYRVESYELPFVRDDRVSGTTLARRLLGLPALNADHVVVRIHSSHARPYGPGLIAAYAPECAAVSVGDLTLADNDQPLSVAEFWRDMQHLSACGVPHIYLAGMPTLIANGWHSELCAGGWVRRSLPPRDEVQHQVARMRAGVRALLWAGARPQVMLPLLIPVLLLVRRMVWRHDERASR